VASIRKEISTRARVEDVWEALRDIGALHTRLVPGFVVDTQLEADARIVTFGNGMTVRSAAGGSLMHHNASAQAFADAKGKTTVVWITDLLPDEAAARVAAMMEQGMTVMRQTLDRLAR